MSFICQSLFKAAHYLVKWIKHMGILFLLSPYCMWNVRKITISNRVINLIHINNNMFIISFIWHYRQLSVKRNKQAGKYNIRQTGRWTDRQAHQHLPDCHKRCPLHRPTAVNGKLISLAQTPLTSSPGVRGLTSVQRYLSRANIAWHDEGAVA